MSVSADVSEISRELPLTPNAVVVLKSRYLKKDEKGEPRRRPRRCSAGWRTPSPPSTETTTPKPTWRPRPGNSTR